MDFKIGMITDSLKKDIFLALKDAMALGVDGVQFYATKELAPAKLSKSKRNDIKSALSDCGLEVSAVCADLGGHGFVDRKENMMRIEASKAVFELAKELDCDIITTHIGVVPEDKNNERYQIMKEACFELGEFAASMNSCFAIETGPERASILKDFLIDVDSKGARVNLDPANLVMVTGDDPVKAVSTLSDFIVHTHAKDGVMLYKKSPEVIYGLLEDIEKDKKAFLEVPLGKGDVPFESYLNALANIGFNGYLTIEREVGDTPLEDIKLAVDFLKELINKR